MNARPSRLAGWLATRRVPRDEREFVLGDLDEEFAERAGTSDGVLSTAAARLWYWRQALRCLIARSPRQIVTERDASHRSMNLVQDIRFALRILRRMPGFTVTAVLTLALGIGAATGMFSVVHAVLGAPLPFSTGDRLVIVREGSTLRDSTSVSYQRFEEWREDNVLEHTAGVFLFDPSLTGAGDPERLSGLRVSASFFDAVNLRPALGTTFTRADESRSVEPKVLIGDGLWRRRFGASPDIIGRRISLSDVTFTVVGVLPAGFRLRPTDPIADVIGPLRLNDTVAPPSLNFMTVVGLLRPGQRLEEARDRLQSSVRLRHPDQQPPLSTTVARLRDVLDAESRPVLLALLAAVAFLLLIACANLANLQLARATDRSQEFAIRRALGAAPGRLLRQLLTESLVLSVIGGVAGVAVAWLSVTLAKDMLPVRAAGAYDVSVSAQVFTFAALMSVLSGVLVGLAPALAAGRRSLRASMGDAGRVVSARPLRSSLVAAEVALAFVLLVGTGLLTRSFDNLLHVDKGFDPDRVLSFELSIPAVKYPDGPQQTAFFRSAVEGLARIPGVASVGLTNARPLDHNGVNGSTPIEGITFPPGQGPMPEKRIVSPAYFRTLGVRVLAGRTFSEQDTTGMPAVMVVSDSFARRYFGTREAALGRRAAFDWDMDGMQEIIGVVNDVKHYGLDEGDVPMVYVSYLQRPISDGAFVLKATGDAAGLTAAARDVIRGLDRDRPLTSIETMDSAVAASLAPRRLSLGLVAGFSVIGLFLAVAGIYGVASFLARQRTREFGIRVALGAASGHLTRLVLRQGLLPVCIGLVAGAVGAFFLTRLIRAQLFGVQPADPATFLVMGAALAAIAIVASASPALRAGRVDPVKALRER
ncbi:MAG TPA: ABC transporter permease [Vicinamibacterales bacterium]|nr:ABC transporter permease [Vicinamibacterales bacterium]